jgi:threonine dehydratase
VNPSLVEMIGAAEQQLRPHVRETPLVPSAALSERAGAEVWLKCENLQVTGSFKVRGATNRLLNLRVDARTRGVVAASSGNHGVAVAHAGRALGIPVTVYVPEFASPVKVAAMQRLGAIVVKFGTDGLDTEIEARNAAALRNREYISPYNDLLVMAGQGTIGVELRRQLPDIDAVVVAVGGGGLIGAVAAELKHHRPGVRVIGAQPANSRVMAESVRAGRVLDLPSQPTLSDGTAGGVELDTVTFPFCRDLVDEWIDVSEADIASSMRRTIEEEHMLVEGAAAVAIAVVAERRTSLTGRVAVIVCGANVSAERVRSVL